MSSDSYQKQCFRQLRVRNTLQITSTLQHNANNVYISFLLNGSQLSKMKKVDSLHVTAIKMYRVEAVGLSISNYT